MAEELYVAAYAGMVLFVLVYSLLVLQNVLVGVSVAALLGLVYLVFRLVVALEVIAENMNRPE